MSSPQEGKRTPGDQVPLVVARGHEDLLESLKGVAGAWEGVKVIVDRRQDRTILPRTSGEIRPLFTDD